VRPANNPPNSDGLGVYHGTVPEWAVRVYWWPGTPIWQRFGLDPDPDPKWRSGTVANTPGEPAGIWTPYHSLVWSLLDILLLSRFYSHLQSLLDDCITVQCLRATAERCKHLEKLSFPCDTFARWKSMSCCKVLHECWQTESTWLSASGTTMFTISNTIIITLITMAIIPLTLSLSALDLMYTHIPTICKLQAADFARTSES